MTRKRLYCTESTYAYLEQLAEYYGHGDVTAALASLAKLGIPLLTGEPLVTDERPTQTKPEPKAQTKRKPKKTKAEELGFQFLGQTDGLVAQVFSEGSKAGATGEAKGSWSEVSDDCVAALANQLEDF